MARLNTKAVGVKTKNLAGGTAYQQTAKQELVHLLLTSFLKDTTYTTGSDQMTRLQTLMASVDPKFAAKAAIYARREFGMRSITHALAGEIAHNVKGEQWTKDFFRDIVYRPDDMMEILAYLHSYKRYEPNALKKGFASALEGMDAYRLGKYRGEGKEMSLVDVVNLVHPRHTEALGALVNGTLEAPETWEVMLTQAGQAGGSEQEIAYRKAGVWFKLLSENKLGYFALLRNLRNIATQAPDCLDMALEQLTNEEAIRRSLVMPFRFLTAYKQFDQIGRYRGYHYGTHQPTVDVSEPAKRKIIAALSRALDLSLSNVPVLDGDTLVVVDGSGSMFGGASGTPPIEIASVFAAALVKANNADLMTFDGSAKYHTVNTADSTITIASKIVSEVDGGVTNFSAPFELANRHYDRIIILSDMQGWVKSGYYGNTHPGPAFDGYKRKYDANPQVYTFDLTGHGTMQFPQDRVYCLAGFSDKVFDLMKVIEKGDKALIKVIEDSVNL